MRRFGSRVTVIDHNDRLAHKEDEDVSHGLQDLFRDEGIDVVTGAHVGGVEGKSGESVTLRVVTQSGVEKNSARKPPFGCHRSHAEHCRASDWIFAGVELTKHGAISRSMNICERLLPTPGPLVNAPEALNSRTSRSTIFE